MIIYKCDICNREVEGVDDLDTLGLATRSVDVCWFCKQKMKVDYREQIREFDNNFIEELKKQK
jgi:hypothetical protein